MSIAEIPDWLYWHHFNNAVASLVERGVWLDQARERAAEIMQGCFVARSTAEQIETQKDYDEERLGGNSKDWTR